MPEEVKEIHKEVADQLEEFLEYNNYNCDKCKKDIEELRSVDKDTP